MEMLAFGISIGIIICIIIIGVVVVVDTRNNKTKLHNNNSRTSNISNNDRNDRSMDRNNSCYKDGELTNLCTIIALKNIKREMTTMLSNMEKDAIDKAIKNTVTVENLYDFIELKDKENE